MRPEIIIMAKNEKQETAWGFTKSRTGVIDFEGKIEVPDTVDYQQLVASTYFSPAWYTYLKDGLESDIRIFTAQDCDISEPSLFAFITHVGALLMAVEENDTLLAGELLCRRSRVFENFAQLVQYIIDPIAPEIYFSMAYGTMRGMSDCGIMKTVLNQVKDKLGFDPQSETLEQAYTRYFRKKEKTELTMQVVGLRFSEWVDGLRHTSNINDNREKILTNPAAARKAKHDFLASLEVSVQAEPYNTHDEFAIAVMIDDIHGKLDGYCGKTRAGYIRRTGASIIRNAKAKKLSFGGQLYRVFMDSDMDQVVVVKMTI